MSNKDDLAKLLVQQQKTLRNNTGIAVLGNDCKALHLQTRQAEQVIQQAMTAASAQQNNQSNTKQEVTKK